MKKILLACIVVFIIGACKKSTSTTPGSGPLEVYVTLYDQFGNRLPGSAADSVVVTIISSEYNNLTKASNINLISPYYLRGITDATGKCLFNNLPRDTTFTFIFSKTNYGTIVNYNFTFQPESTPYTLSVNMAAVSQTVVSNLTVTPRYAAATATIASKDSVWLSCSIGAPLSPYNSVRFFWGTDSTICPDSNYISTFVCNTINNYNVMEPGSGLIGSYFYPSQYSRDSAGISLGIDSGTVLYAIACGEVNDPTVYTNIAVSNLRYSNGNLKYPGGIAKYPNLNATISKNSGQCP